MLRSAAGILALLILPGFLSAQETSTFQPRTHEVVKGETLWDLAGRYLGNPFRWPLIAEANRGLVVDPDLIYPGEVLVIPPLSQELARVEGVSVVPPGGVPAAPPQAEPQAPQGPPRVGGTGAPPCPGPENRTVFYRGGVADRGCPMVFPRPDQRTSFYRQGAGQEAGPAGSSPFPGRQPSAGTRTLPWIPLGPVYASPWLEPWGSEPESVARVGGFSGDVVGTRSTDRAVLMEHLRVDPAAGASFRVGDLLQSFRISRRDEELGVVCSPTGILTVTSVTPAGVEAMLSVEFDRVQVGDFLRPAPDYMPRPGARPLAVQSNVVAEILGFPRDRPIQGLMAKAFLSVGQREGIAIGDEFVAFANETGEPTEPEAARLQVVLVGATTSTARVIAVTDPVLAVGDRVLLVKKMQ